MGLYNFFTVNMPYGIVVQGDRLWSFNREYQPLGHSDKNDTLFEIGDIHKMRLKHPMTEKELTTLFDGCEIQRRYGHLIVFFYDDKSNPCAPNVDKEKLDSYFLKIAKALAIRCYE